MKNTISVTASINKKVLTKQIGVITECLELMREKLDNICEKCGGELNTVFDKENKHFWLKCQDCGERWIKEVL